MPTGTLLGDRLHDLLRELETSDLARVLLALADTLTRRHYDRTGARGAQPCRLRPWHDQASMGPAMPAAAGVPARGVVSGERHDAAKPVDAPLLGRPGPSCIPGSLLLEEPDRAELARAEEWLALAEILRRLRSCRARGTRVLRARPRSAGQSHRHARSCRCRRGAALPLRRRPRADRGVDARSRPRRTQRDRDRTACGRPRANGGGSPRTSSPRPPQNPSPQAISNARTSTAFSVTCELVAERSCASAAVRSAQPPSPSAGQPVRDAP